MVPSGFRWAPPRPVTTLLSNFAISISESAPVVVESKAHSVADFKFPGTTCREGCASATYGVQPNFQGMVGLRQGAGSPFLLFPKTPETASRRFDSVAKPSGTVAADRACSRRAPSIRIEIKGLSRSTG